MKGWRHSCLLFALLSAFTVTAQNREVLVGMTDTAAYFPRLEGRRVAVLANHTSVAQFEQGTMTGDPAVPASATQTEPSPQFGSRPQARTVHLVDLLHERGFTLTGIFAPEHGFRGEADAGEHILSSVDARTGIAIRSLYDGNARRPSDEAMRSFDVLVVDMQDVGLRFYTYYISMLRLMEACADFGRSIIVLDRPNPNGHLIDGPILEDKHRSGVGALPIPVLHGLTMGEIARMSVGEGWTPACDLHVVACRNYTHDTPYPLPIAPSPNLPTQRAVCLYGTLCLFEGTVVSVGRGTDTPFEIFGHPLMRGYDFSFTPHPTVGAKHPPLEGARCYGVDLSAMPLDRVREVGFTLRYLIEACRNLDMGDGFFTPMFEKLIGVDYVREMVLAGASEREIRARWQAPLENYKTRRQRYLLYPDTL